jgi:putative methyltransferase (TIGR04325 family)
MTEYYKVPILLIVFNRIETTVKVFDVIKRIKPLELFIAADGHRLNIPGEVNRCEEVRSYLLNNIDWECEVKTLFNDINLGCGKAVSRAIKWFFSYVNEGVIIEDDCILDQSFFRFSEEMLSKYRNDESVGLIGSVYLRSDNVDITESYYFSIYPEIWGWATWKRVIEKYDFEMLDWGRINKNRFLKKILHKSEFVNYWKPIFDLTFEKKIDTWDYQLVFSCWLNNFLTIIPSKNLVENIGLNSFGTHFSDVSTVFGSLMKESLDFPLIEQTIIKQNEKKDYHTQVTAFGLIKKKSKVSVLFITIIRIIKKSIAVLFEFWKTKDNINDVLNWKGNFLDWEIALHESTGYDSNEIIQKCKSSINKVINNEAVYERDSFVLEFKDYSWPLVSGLLMAALDHNKKLNVLDFGGSLGSTFFQVKDLLEPSVELFWNVVEQKKFVDEGKDTFENDKLKFYYTIQECLKNNNCNVAVLSSVMQYLEEPYQPLNELVQCRIDYIIIDRTLFIKGDKPVITVQTVPESIYKASYPCWLLNENELIDSFNRSYKIIAEFDSKIDSCNYENTYYKGFILKRNV